MVGGECRWRGGGLTCLQGVRTPQMTTTVSSLSFWPSFAAGVCGNGEWGSWGWSVVSGDGGVGDLPVLLFFLSPFPSLPLLIPFPLLLFLLLLLGHPRAWCETVIGLSIAAVRGISRMRGGGGI